MKFRAENIKKIVLSDSACHERRHSGRHCFTYRRRQNSVRAVHIYSAIWPNFGIRYLKITLLCICEFRIIHIREGCTLPGDVNEIALVRVPRNRVAQ